MANAFAPTSGGHDPACSDPDVPDPGQSAAVAGDVADNQVEALRFLQQTHGPVLLNFLTRLTGGDVHRAEGIVQETLLRAWRNPEARHADGRWSRAYIFTVAKRIFIDQVRMAEARPQEISDEQIGTHALAEDPTERMLDRHEVRAALDALPERLRQTLVEIHFKDRPVSEVAEVLDVPEGTVKSRTFYALRATREPGRP
ncbi:sigma-70 family RNA polymerase sigma factor [Micromonospora sp. R77]|uniref:sigma-70 family RNA polymerase sigma factor n=1 Tax=Micromonospora sp. R77 TaxID=2925836 RepID=UPI001F60BF59|nr:sigma-70 family RNA polymerase sigma factor [Micromonospora sp. R77]MCI4061409.1 sigma-70 family RNA polymerase sigma factor [Micromonospora sp. R77]